MTRLKWVWVLGIVAVVFLLPATHCFSSEETVKIALNYPETGPYAKEGKDQWYAAEIARKEINDAGGILGRKVVYRWYDSASNPNKTRANVLRPLTRKRLKWYSAALPAPWPSPPERSARKRKLSSSGH
jgi:hypothetical protein